MKKLFSPGLVPQRAVEQYDYPDKSNYSFFDAQGNCLFELLNNRNFKGCGPTFRPAENFYSLSYDHLSLLYYAKPVLPEPEPVYADRALYREIHEKNIADELRGKPFVVYIIGHHGFSWAIIARDSIGYKAFTGSTNNNGGILDNDADPLDIPATHNANKQLIDWALHSMPAQSRRMEPIEPTVYITLCSAIDVYDAQGRRVHNGPNRTCKFNGPDSAAFSENYENLQSLLTHLLFDFLTKK